MTKRDVFVAGLLEWYEGTGRHDLPWRARDASAYEVLVAEVMLQKTSAGQVLKVFEEFAEERAVGRVLPDFQTA